MDGVAHPRVAGRVLLIDEACRVLLIESNVDVGAEATHWITPGGGTDPGETPAQAAMRELYEELGLRADLAGDASPDHTDRERFTFNGHTYDQTNHYFVVRMAPGTPVAARGADEIEQSVLVGERWWSVAELRASEATIYPVGLADLLARLCRDQLVPPA
jgi:8-oxo-dGTP pyrophosphatase MutT (NUDIX family)